MAGLFCSIEATAAATKNTAIGMAALWRACQHRYHAAVIQMNFEIPEVDPLGRLSAASPGGRARIIQRLNLELWDAAQQAGVSVLDVEFLRFEPDMPKGIPEGFLEAGARLGAQYVLVMSTEPLEARTLERLRDLCERAQQYGLHYRSHPAASQPGQSSHTSSLVAEPSTTPGPQRQ